MSLLFWIWSWKDMCLLMECGAGLHQGIGVEQTVQQTSKAQPLVRPLSVRSNMQASNVQGHIQRAQPKHSQASAQTFTLRQLQQTTEQPLVRLHRRKLHI